MAREKAPEKVGKKITKRPIEQYDHKSKTRVNNPPVGLVTPRTDPPVTSRKTYEYDPHLDPQLVWAGKKEHSAFEISTVSLHVHERIDPRTIIEAVRKRNGVPIKPAQGYLFESREENPPLREAVDFYRHSHGWTNRLIAGDSLLVMNSLLEKEGMAGQIQTVYIDPPYGIRYGSNFQPFVNRREVKDGRDEDLTQEPEMVRAFRDTWELGIHSYLTYLRDRLLLAKELLNESGSCFVQIGEQNLHHVQELMDEVFLAKNFVRLIHYTTAGGFTSTVLSRAGDFLLWYARDSTRLKYRPLFETKPSPIQNVQSKYDQIELLGGHRRPMTAEEKQGKVALPDGSRTFRFDTLVSGGFRQNTTVDYEFEGRKYHPGANNNWKASVPEGMDRLAGAKRIAATSKGKLVYVRYFDDFPAVGLTSMWSDIGGTVQSRSDPKVYVVQTGTSVIERCILMTTDTGDLVFDPTCGSGSTAFVAEQWGRRWMTCDTSRVAITIAKQRLMGAAFDYYKLAHPDEGVGSGFEYKKIKHVSLRSLSNNEPPGEETLYDQPLNDTYRTRISGPFTVEAVPAPSVQSIDEIEGTPAQETGKQKSIADRESRLFSRIAGRRPAGYVRASESSKVFDDPGIFIPLDLPNKIRPRVSAWRDSGYPGVSGITKRLLEYWHDGEQRDSRRLFFCQLEAIETLIWLPPPSHLLGNGAEMKLSFNGSSVTSALTTQSNPVWLRHRVW